MLGTVLQHSLVIEHGGILLIAGEAEQDRLGWMESVVGDQGKIHFGKSLWKPRTLRQCRLLWGMIRDDSFGGRLGRALRGAMGETNEMFGGHRRIM